MKVIYSNISGGLIFAGKKYGEMLFSQVSLEKYVEYFKSKSPDVLSLCEVHLESRTSSQMVERLSQELNLPHHSALAMSGSHLDTSKQLGMAVLSRYPITKQEEFTLPNPKLEVDRPNGDHWVMHDKGGQRVYLDVDGKTVALINLQYFAFHRFNRRVDEPQFREQRLQLVETLKANSENAACIVTGDFNNQGLNIGQAFPELFDSQAFERAVKVKSSLVGVDEQFDHILYQPEFFQPRNQFADLNGSDHLAIGAELDINLDQK